MSTTILISAESFIYDLRVASSLLRGGVYELHNQDATDCALSIIDQVIRRIEDGSSVFLVAEAQRPAPETGLGAD